MSIQAIEPVQTPPQFLQSDVLTRIEFANPTQIGLRCSARGAEFMGMPALSAGGCADRNLITMIDPCRTVTGGRFAEELCIAVGTSTEDVPDADSANEIRIAFASVLQVGSTCSSGGDEDSGSALVCRSGSGLIARNPCQAPAPSWYERTLCHEIGHVNGWPANHPAAPQALKLARASSSPQALSFSSQGGAEPALD